MKLQNQLLITTLIAGTLDIIAACISNYLVSGTTPDRILKFIASGVFGKDALNGGFGMMATGLLFHFIISFTCTLAFFLLYPKLSFLKKSILLNAVLIGITAWFVTTQIIIPLSNIKTAPLTFISAFRAIIILILCIGFPISYGAKKYFTKSTN